MKRVFGAVVGLVLGLGFSVVQTGCGGCPLVAGKASAVTVSPAQACLALHVSGTQANDTGGSRCVGGVTVVGTNGCTEAFVLTPPVEGLDGSVAEVTFAAGAAVKFNVDEARGTSTTETVSWTIPAKVGAQAVTVTLSVPRI